MSLVECLWLPHWLWRVGEEASHGTQHMEPFTEQQQQQQQNPVSLLFT